MQCNAMQCNAIEAVLISPSQTQIKLTNLIRTYLEFRTLQCKIQI